MFTIVCCLVVRLGLGLGLDLVSGLVTGYAHVFVGYTSFGCYLHCKF